MSRNENEKTAYLKGYIADALGCVRNIKGDVVRLMPHNKCYKKFNIRHEGKHLRVSVHRLVAYQKFGDAIHDEKIVVRHLDGDGGNNSFQNIEIGTNHDNKMDIPVEVRIFLAKNASKNRIILSDLETLELQRLHSDGYRMSYLMDRFNIRSKGSYSNYLNKIVYIEES